MPPRTPAACPRPQLTPCHGWLCTLAPTNRSNPTLLRPRLPSASPRSAFLNPQSPPYIPKRAQHRATLPPFPCPPPPHDKNGAVTKGGDTHARQPHHRPDRPPAHHRTLRPPLPRPAGEGRGEGSVSFLLFHPLPHSSLHSRSPHPRPQHPHHRLPPRRPHPPRSRSTPRHHHHPTPRDPRLAPRRRHPRPTHPPRQPPVPTHRRRSTTPRPRAPPPPRHPRPRRLPPALARPRSPPPRDHPQSRSPTRP